MTSARMASSSRPISATSSALSTTGSAAGVERRNGLRSRARSGPGRVIIGDLSFVVSGCRGGARSDLDVDVADRRADAQLDRLIGFGVDRAGGRIAGAARAAHRGAGEADAHPAAVGRGQPGAFGLLEQGVPGVLGGDV